MQNLAARIADKLEPVSNNKEDKVSSMNRYGYTMASYVV
jgi:hypothetical protein